MGMAWLDFCTRHGLMCDDWPDLTAIVYTSVNTWKLVSNAYNEEGAVGARIKSLAGWGGGATPPQPLHQDLIEPRPELLLQSTSGLVSTKHLFRHRLLSHWPILPARR